MTNYELVDDCVRMTQMNRILMEIEPLTVDEVRTNEDLLNYISQQELDQIAGKWCSYDH